MSSVTMNFTGEYAGFPLSAGTGDRVVATVPSGCVLRVSTDLQTWLPTIERDFAHLGAAASYRIDCDSFTVPVTATLNITPA